MNAAVRLFLSDGYKAKATLQLKHPPLIDVVSAVQQQTQFLGMHAVTQSWQEHEARLLFKSAPEALLIAPNNKSNKPVVYIFFGFWRWNYYQQQVDKLIAAKGSTDLLIFIDDCLSAVNVPGALQVPYSLSTYSEAISPIGRPQSRGPKAWIESLFLPPEEDDYEKLDVLISKGAQCLNELAPQPPIRLRIFDLILKNLSFSNQCDDIVALELLIEQFRTSIGRTLQFEPLKDKTGTSADSLKRWTQILENHGLIFSISPWHKNINRAIKSDKKFYFHDWIFAAHKELIVENLVTSVIISKINQWNTKHEGQWSLHHIKTKDQICFDLLLCKDEQPVLAIDICPSDSNSTKNKYKILQALDCPYVQITEEPLVWVDNKMGKTLSLSHFLRYL